MPYDAKVVRLKPIEPDAAKAQEYLKRARAVDRQQQAKSWETSRRNEHGATLGKPANCLLPCTVGFTEGFDTRDCGDIPKRSGELCKAERVGAKYEGN